MGSEVFWVCSHFQMSAMKTSAPPPNNSPCSCGPGVGGGGAQWDLSLLWTNIWTNLTLNAPPLIGWLLSLVPYYINRFHILVVLWCFLVAERERERGARVGDRVTDKWVDIKRQVAPYGKCVCVCSVLVVEYDNWWWLVFLVFFVTHYPPLTAPSVSPSSYSLLS